VKNTRISKFKYATAPLALGLALISTPSFAQDEAAEEEAGEAIIVTGSRIARPNIEAASPVTVVSAEQVALTGTTTVETLLNELPQVVAGNTRVSNNSGGENFSTIDLRGLGPGRTLILLNGERLPASTTTGVTDVSQIPTGLIERIDVVTGGASAVYGSDAIAGVVNFILKKDFEGVELVGQTSLSEDGTGFGFNVSGLVGGNFADGKGNLTVYGSFTDRSSVSQSRYNYSRVSGALLFDPNVDVGTGYPARTVTDPSQIATLFPDGFGIAAGGGSATPPWGTIAASTLAGTQFRNLSTLLPSTFAGANTDCNTATAGVNVGSTGTVSFNDARQLSPLASGGFCTIPIRGNGSSRYNFAPQNYLITPYDRLTLTATGRYEFDDKTRLNVYTSFTNANQQVNLAPTPATGIVVTTAAPFIPADLAAALAARTYFARTAGVGASGTAFDAGRFTSAAACRTVGDTPNDAPAANCVETSAANEPFVINRRFSETGPRDGRFKTNAVNVRAILEHDLSDNWQVNGVFSYGRVDNSLRGIGNINRTAVAQGLLSCPAGSLPGCVPINLFGADTLTPAMLSFVRVDTQQTEAFEQVRAAVNLTGSLGELPGGPIGIAAGAEYRKDSGEGIVDDAQRTGDIYGFNAVQSLAGSISVKEVYGEIRLPILDMLSVGAGARYSDYSSVGGLFNWKAEAELTPVDFLKLRASYNRAARAPNVFELFQNGDQGFPSYVDPCNDTAARSAAVLARCVAGAPGANFTGFAQANGQVQAFAFGNPNLSEEKAETWTAGAVLNFDNVVGGALTLTADYYNIKLTNRVAGLGAGFFIAGCYNGGDAASCARIVRDPGTGQITSVDTTVTNSATPLKTSGVDVGLDWSVEALGGRFSLSNVFTYVDSYKIGTTEYSDTVFSGIGGVTIKYGNALTAGFRKDGTTVQLRHVWKKGGRQNFAGAELEGFFPDSARIPDLNLLNLSLRQQIGDNFEFTAIVNNLLNKYPPVTATGYFEQANTNISFYDPYALGRNYTIQARVKF
jgi:iron complex outermembrane receptor protein